MIQSETFAKWLKSLRDRKAQRRIARRIERIAEDSYFGDHHSVGDGVSELRIDYGPGYRVYFTIRRNTVVLLLSGGDKDSQRRDIDKAKAMAKEV